MGSVGLAPSERMVRNECMSFDLQVFPASGPSTVAEAHRLLDAEEQRLISGADSPLPAPSPEMARFMGEIKHRWPSLEDDPDGSPWTIEPSWGPSLGGGAGLAIKWSCPDSVLLAIFELADRVGVIVYDSQAEVVHLPGGASAR